MKKLKSIKLIPTFKDYIWGGNRLVNEYNKKCDLERVAESQELSTHKDGESVVTYGEFKGLTLSEYIKSNECDVLGKNGIYTIGLIKKFQKKNSEEAQKKTHYLIISTKKK